jgi:hypothetical protein
VVTPGSRPTPLDADGAPRSDPSSYAKKFSGRYEHRLINGGVGTICHSKRPQAFAEAIVDVRGELIGLRDLRIGKCGPQVADASRFADSHW